MDKMYVKTKKEIEIMEEGGKRLHEIKEELARNIKVGVSAYEIEELADKLIKKSGGVASFKMVPGYKWATCINVNEGIVHGIPKKEVIFKKNDLVSIDCGFYYKGFHTDTSYSLGVEADARIDNFLNIGKKALKNAISEAKVGNFIYDISKATETTLKKGKVNPVKSLVGHGVGRNLHEEPQIPCFTLGMRNNSVKIENGLTIAIEVMYTLGDSELVILPDRWTIATRDGKISGLFEETIAVTEKGPKVLT